MSQTLIVRFQNTFGYVDQVLVKNTQYLPKITFWPYTKSKIGLADR